MTTDPLHFRTARVRGSGDSFSTDWSPHIDRVLLQLAQLLDRVGPDRWERAAIQPGWTVRDVAGLLLWRLGTPPSERVRAYSRRVITQPGSILRDQARLSGATELPSALRAVVTERSESPRRGSLPALSVAVVGAFEIAAALGETIEIGPVASETVAAVRTLAAPVSVRTVLRRATLRAVDAGWEVGRGPVIASTASAVLLFLFGHTGPPEASVSEDEAPARQP